MGKLVVNIITAVSFKPSGVLPVDQALGPAGAGKKAHKSKGDHVVPELKAWTPPVRCSGRPSPSSRSGGGCCPRTGRQASSETP